MAGIVRSNIQLGDSLTATQNFTLTAAAADGTLKLARGNAGATTQDILTVDAAGVVTARAGLNVTSTGTAALNITGVGNAGIELGSLVGASTPYIDFHSGAVITDFDSRIISSGGTGASAGGSLNIVTTLLTKNGSLIYDRSNILGTVSQASGVPTGAVVERGSNANGEYVRFADGAQICAGTLPSLTVSANTQIAAPVQAYPAAFSGFAPALTVLGIPTTSSDVFGFIYEQQNSLVQIQPVYRNGATAQTIVAIRYTAVGRWF